jgi:hypothetical protein
MPGGKVIGAAGRARWPRAFTVGGLASLLVLAMVVAAVAARAPAYCPIHTVDNPPGGLIRTLT